VAQTGLRPSRLAHWRRAGGGAGGQVAKDALGNDVKSNAWLATHAKGDHSLVQGLKVRRRIHCPDRTARLHCKIIGMLLPASHTSGTPAWVHTTAISNPSSLARATPPTWW
jgi:hypothetical protein